MLTSPPVSAAETSTEFQSKSQQIRALCWHFVLIALTVWLVWNVAQTVGRVIDYYTPLPMWDYWRVVEHLPAYKALQLGVFWRQHNEHRIVFPEIAFALDMLLLHGRMILPLVLSFLCYLATWAVLSSAVFADRTIDLKIRVSAILLAGVVSLWQSAANVLGLPFLLQWTLMQLAVALTFSFLSRLRARPSTGALCGTIAAAVVATYSSGNALLLWPLVLTVAVLIRLRRRELTILIGAAVITLGLYFVGYHFTGDLKLSNFLHYPLYSLEYMGAYLSMPFGGMRTPMFGVRLGLFSCALVVALFVVLAAKGRALARPSVVLFSYWVFTLLTAALTAGGRMDPTDQKFIAAEAFRYLTVPQMNWAVVILLLVPTLSAVQITRRYTLGLVTGLGLLSFVAFQQLMPWLDGIANFFTEQQLAAMTVQDGLHNTYWIKTKIFPSIQFYDNYAPRLRADGVSIYHRGLNRFLGHPKQDIGSVQNVPISGLIARVLPVESGYQVGGWVDISKWRRPYTWVVLADEKGTVLGFGRRFAAGLPTAADSPTVPSSLAWVGFISSRWHPDKVYAYVEAPRGRALYPLIPPIGIVPSEIGPSKVVGAPISDFRWEKDPALSSQTLPAKVDFGDRPGTDIVSSWNGSDANVETIRSAPFRRPGKACVLVPVLHGPSVDGLSMRIIDAPKGTPITELPLQPADQQWQYWRVTIPAAAEAIAVEANDEGSGWGQWIAVATPQACP